MRRVFKALAGGYTPGMECTRPGGEHAAAALQRLAQEPEVDVADDVGDVVGVHAHVLERLDPAAVQLGAVLLGKVFERNADLEPGIRVTLGRMICRTLNPLRTNSCVR